MQGVAAMGDLDWGHRHVRPAALMKVEEPKRCLGPKVRKVGKGVTVTVCVMTWLNIPGVKQCGA